MPVETEADRQDLLADFGDEVTVTVKGQEIPNAIFDREFLRLDLGDDVGMASREPQITFSSADVQGVRQDDPVTVQRLGEALQSWKVKEVEPDGTGMTVLSLKVA